MSTTCQVDINRLRTNLDTILAKYEELSLAEDAPFVVYLTERMLADIETARKSCQKIRRHATWPSLN